VRHAFDRGGCERTIALGVKIDNRQELTEDDIRRMHSYLQGSSGARKDGRADISDPSVAYINWMIHGGDEGLAWASEKVDMLRLKREKPSQAEYKSRRIMRASCACIFGCNVPQIIASGIVFLWSDSCRSAISARKAGFTRASLGIDDNEDS